MGIHLKLLGKFNLSRENGEAIRLTSSKAQGLLAYLALNPDQNHSRYKLATLLWGRHDEEHARNNLSQCLYHLRRALAPHAARILEANNVGVTLKADGVAVDVLDVRRLAADGSHSALQKAADLCADGLLSNFEIREEIFSEWLAREREAVAKLMTDLLTHLGEFQLDAGEGESAVETASRLVSSDPLNEAACRLLMRANVSVGRRNSALQQYQTCVETLHRELGVEPDAATKALHQEIRSGGSDGGLLDVIPNNLPTSVSSFIGRQTEIAEVVELLGTTRLLTLVGAGGSGKTRLCLEVAAEVLVEYSDGAWFVELAGLYVYHF